MHYEILGFDFQYMINYLEIPSHIAYIKKYYYPEIVEIDHEKQQIYFGF